MDNVLRYEINPEIKLDPVKTASMPDDIRGGLLMAITHAAKKYSCSWDEITWSVTMSFGQPVIKVKHGN